MCQYEIKYKYAVYYTKSNNNHFMAQCIFCNEEQHGLIRYYHLARHFKTNYHIKEKARRLEQLKAKTQAVPSSLSSNNKLLQNYEILWNTKAKCIRGTCKFQCDYIKLENLTNHMKQKHKDYFEYEIKWAYFGKPFLSYRYYKKPGHLQCIHCQEYVCNKKEVFEVHFTNHIR